MHWLQFRGPNATGIAPENADLPIYFSADTNLLWKTEIPPGWSSPCIVNEKIFLTGFDDADSLLYTFAVDRKTGKMIWQDSLKPAGYYYRHPLHGYANPSIASDGKRIFAAFPNYGMAAYNLEGKMIWEYPHEVISWFYNAGASSPIIVDSVVVYLVNSKQDPRIMFLDTRSGDSVLTIRAPEEEWSTFHCSSTPVVCNDLLILHLDQNLVAYEMSDGTLKWWLPVFSTGVGTPVLKEDRLYVNTWYNTGEKSVRGNLPTFAKFLEDSDKNSNGLIEREEISDDMMIFRRPETPDAPMANFTVKQYFNRADLNKDKAIDEDEWLSLLETNEKYMKDHGMLSIPIECSGERSHADVIWKINKDTPETPSPLVVNENVLFIKNGGIITVINQESGEVVHKDRIGATGTYLSSPLLAGTRIYTCSFNGTVSVLSADDYSVLAHNIIKEKIAASPVAVDDVLYIRTDRHLYAFRDQ
jgi:outer membrane protein assembly factor BamB